MKDLVIYVGAYLLGSIPMGRFLGKKKKAGSDRKFGPKMVLDALKGAAAVTLAHVISPGDAPDWVFAGLLALMGDEFPLYTRFKGERGLGTVLGVFAALLFWMLTR